MKKSRLLSLAILAIISSLSVAQTTWYVSTTGDDEYNTGSELSPWASIKKSITEANSGDIIHVEAGIYTEVNITVSKDVTIIGKSAASTIIQATASKPDGAGTDMAPNQRVFLINTSVTATLKNMSIRYGNISGGVGGGINTQISANLTLESCNIYDNFTDAAAGGVGGYGKVTIRNCSIFDNKAKQNGGGLAFFGTPLSMENCVIYRNHSDAKGGAIAMANDGATLSLNNNTITNNTTSSDVRKGIYFNLGTCTTLTNNILFNASSSGVDFGYDGGANPVAESIIKNNIISKCWLEEIRNEANSITWESNTAVTESNLKLGPLQDNGNGIHTLALKIGSIAIGAADATTATPTDIHGTSRTGNPDIGAYEYSTATNIDHQVIDTRITPNPSNGTFNIMASELSNGQVDIYALNGKLIHSSPIIPGNKVITLPSYINGMVFIKVSGNDYSQVYKHIVRK
ncbi:right-handed parallel beta-helix repeat-containing protein [Carboxylicivirga taeanensis]|uniref:right-handed parallel beta-helix repeat-containing protein n=1 Tax=Carboxylicivirga taeanensis TaxID=1416875 RepID=UPI003F6DD5D4